MKKQIERLIQIALTQLQEAGELPAIPAFIQIDFSKDKSHGDFACNIALTLAKAAGMNPRALAQKIVDHFPESPHLEKVEIAGPGFINFFLSPLALNDVVFKILTEKENFGRSESGRRKRVIVEFVSSNPTGPLHVGHGRHAAFGAVLSDLLEAVGFLVHREYYVNDAGRQMDILATSIWLRYLALCGESITFPANGYKGDYISEIATELKNQFDEQFYVPAHDIFKVLPKDEPEGGDKEIYIDALIDRVKKALEQDYEVVFNFGLERILADMREDLAEFGVNFQNWFSEHQFASTGVVDTLIKKLRSEDNVYEQDGALWFRSTRYGDEKDRVLERSNGQRTYFANDMAYHINKFERGFDIAIDILGSDHHGYLARTKAGIEANGINPERLLYLLVQFVSLYRAGQPVSMSTRGGSFVTLRELRQEVGNDAARFFYVMRKCDQPMDFDLDLAKAKSNENPVYYVQYAYARTCSVLKQLAERQKVYNEENGLANLSLLNEPQERQLLNTLSRYPDMIINTAINYEPHLLTHYLRELASDFHGYYNAHQFIVDESNLRDARLALMMATQQTLKNGLKLLGVSTPEAM